MYNVNVNYTSKSKQAGFCTHSGLLMCDEDPIGVKHVLVVDGCTSCILTILVMLVLSEVSYRVPTSAVSFTFYVVYVFIP